MLIPFLLLIFVELFGFSIAPSFSAGPPYTVGDAFVQAKKMGGGGSGAWTNSTGQYMMNYSVVVGNYSVEASANGCLPAKQNVTIDSISDVKIVDLTLNRSGIIKGKVIDKAGHPVVGAVVSLFPVPSYSAIETTKTDTDGMYYFTNDIDTGSYYMKADFEFDWGSINQQDTPYLDQGYISGRSDSFSATAGVVTTAADLVVNWSGIITGTVRDTYGTPLANAIVTAYSSTPPLRYMQAVTDERGTYRISYEVVNDTYSLQPELYGYVGNMTDVIATQTGTVTQDLIMVRSASVKGHVWRNGDNKPVPDVSIELVSDTYMYWQSTDADQDGYYEINGGLGPANYTATVSLGSETLNETTGIVLDTGQNVTLNFYVDVYFINGIVYENFTDGPRVPYANVGLSFDHPDNPIGGYASSDSNGTYTLVLPIASGTMGNTYNGTFVVSQYNYNTTTVYADVTVGTDNLSMDFVLPKKPPTPPPPSATIMGTIYVNTGASLPFSHQVWHLTDDSYAFAVELNTSSRVNYISTTVTSGYIGLSVWGPTGTTGTLTIWIPKAIFPGPTFTVTSYPSPDPTVISSTEDATNWIITIEYGHSSKYITFLSESAIPEYTGPAMLTAILTAGTILVLLEKKRRTQKRQ